MKNCVNLICRCKKSAKEKFHIGLEEMTVNFVIGSKKVMVNAVIEGKHHHHHRIFDTD